MAVYGVDIELNEQIADFLFVSIAVGVLCKQGIHFFMGVQYRLAQRPIGGIECLGAGEEVFTLNDAIRTIGSSLL